MFACNFKMKKFAIISERITEYCTQIIIIEISRQPLRMKLNILIQCSKIILFILEAMKQYQMKRIYVINNHCIFDNFLLSWQCCTYKHWHIRIIFRYVFLQKCLRVFFEVWRQFLSHDTSCSSSDIYLLLAFLVASSIAFNYYCTSCLYFLYLFTYL